MGTEGTAARSAWRSDVSAVPLVLEHLLIGALDEKFSETETRQLLASIGGAHIEIIED